MNAKASAALAVTAAALAGVTIYLVQTSKPTAVTEGDAKSLFHFTVARVSRITLRKGTDVVYEVQRAAGKWKFVQPPFGDADEAKIVRALSELRISATLENDLGAAAENPLERYGLAKPKMEVSIQSSGESVTYAIGDAAAGKSGVYVHLFDTNRVAVTQKLVMTELDHPAEFFKVAASEAAGPVK